MAHYFTDNSNLRSNPKEFDYYFENENFKFTTDIGVFSKGEIDYGSYLLIKTVYRNSIGEDCLDLGCGYGPIGIIIKRFNPNTNMDSVDVNSRAVDLTKLNASINNTKINVFLSDDITSLKREYNTVLLNPPIRAGKKVIYDLYAKSKEVLKTNGSLYIVIRKKQGADSSFKELQDLFNQVNVIAKSKGYEIIQAIK